jgi:CHASE2 domain-containing sensor protein
MDYHDLEVKVEKDDPPHARAGSCSVHGSRSEVGALLDLAAVEEAIKKLAREDGSVTPEGVQREIGTLLYQGLFGNKVRGLLDMCIGGARMLQDGGLRVNLDFAAAPRLARIPWEFIYHPDLECFLAADPATPLIRLMHSREPNPGLQVDLPVKVLVVIPENAARGPHALDTRREKLILTRALARSNRDTEPQFLEERVTCDRFEDALMGNLPEVGEGPFSVVCYIGHGSAKDGKSYLFFDQDDGEPDPVESERLCDIFRNRKSVKLLVLNACQGATITGLQPFAGLAPQLVAKGVPAVVAMQFPIPDSEALRFAEVFYSALFRPRSGGQIEVALSEAREVLRRADPESRGWGAPVLYMRDTGPLFTPVTGSVGEDLPMRRNEQTVQLDAERVHMRNIEILRGMPPDSGTSAVLAREKRELARVRRLLWLRAAAISAIVLASAAITALPVWPFEAVFPLEARVETYAAWLAGLAGDPLDERIMVAPITQETQSELGFAYDSTTYAAWRAQHAAAIERLASAEARVVVVGFSMVGPEPTDARLARAIREAEDAGTRVVLGWDALSDGQPAIAPSLLSAVRETPGLSCLGFDQTGTVRIVPLVVLRGSAGGAITAIPTLPVATVSAYHGDRFAGVRQETGVGLERGRVVYAGRDGLRTLPYARLEGNPDVNDCAVFGSSDRVAEGIIRYSPISKLESSEHRIEYEDVLRLPPRALAERVRGKIVILGLEDETMVYPVWRIGVEYRYGFEILADAVNAVLRGAPLRPLRSGYQFLVGVLVAGAGALIAYKSRRRSPRRRLLGLSGVAVVYLVGAILATAFRGWLLSVPFHLVALFAAFAGTRYVRRRKDL